MINLPRSSSNVRPELVEGQYRSPFVLSLSKDACQRKLLEEQVGFDRLSPNGLVYRAVYLTKVNE